MVEILLSPGVWRRARPMDWMMSMVLVLGWANSRESMAGMSTPSAQQRQLVRTARRGGCCEVGVFSGVSAKAVKFLWRSKGVCRELTVPTCSGVR